MHQSSKQYLGSIVKSHEDGIPALAMNGVVLLMISCFVCSFYC